MQRFSTIFRCPRLSAAYFTAKPMVLVLGQYSTGTVGMTWCTWWWNPSPKWPHISLTESLHHGKGKMYHRMWVPIPPKILQKSAFFFFLSTNQQLNLQLGSTSSRKSTLISQLLQAPKTRLTERTHLKWMITIDVESTLSEWNDVSTHVSWIWILASWPSDTERPRFHWLYSIQYMLSTGVFSTYPQMIFFSVLCDMFACFSLWCK